METSYPSSSKDISSSLIGESRRLASDSIVIVDEKSCNGDNDDGDGDAYGDVNSNNNSDDGDWSSVDSDDDDDDDNMKCNDLTRSKTNVNSFSKGQDDFQRKSIGGRNCFPLPAATKVSDTIFKTREENDKMQPLPSSVFPADTSGASSRIGYDGESSEEDFANKNNKSNINSNKKKKRGKKRGQQNSVDDLRFYEEEDDDESDELDNISANKLTKDGYLKDGFIIDTAKEAAQLANNSKHPRFITSLAVNNNNNNDEVRSSGDIIAKRVHKQTNVIHKIQPDLESGRYKTISRPKSAPLHTQRGTPLNSSIAARERLAAAAEAATPSGPLPVTAVRVSRSFTSSSFDASAPPPVTSRSEFDLRVRNANRAKVKSSSSGGGGVIGKSSSKNGSKSSSNANKNSSKAVSKKKKTKSNSSMNNSFNNNNSNINIDESGASIFKRLVTATNATGRQNTFNSSAEWKEAVLKFCSSPKSNSSNSFNFTSSSAAGQRHLPGSLSLDKDLSSCLSANFNGGYHSNYTHENNNSNNKSSYRKPAVRIKSSTAQKGSLHASSTSNNANTNTTTSSSTTSRHRGAPSSSSSKTADNLAASNAVHVHNIDSFLDSLEGVRRSITDRNSSSSSISNSSGIFDSRNQLVKGPSGVGPSTSTGVVVKKSTTKSSENTRRKLVNSSNNSSSNNNSYNNSSCSIKAPLSAAHVNTSLNSNSKTVTSAKTAANSSSSSSRYNTSTTSTNTSMISRHVAVVNSNTTSTLSSRRASRSEPPPSYSSSSNFITSFRPVTDKTKAFADLTNSNSSNNVNSNSNGKSNRGGGSNIISKSVSNNPMLNYDIGQTGADGHFTSAKSINISNISTTISKDVKAHLEKTKYLKEKSSFSSSPVKGSQIKAVETTKGSSNSNSNSIKIIGVGDEKKAASKDGGSSGSNDLRSRSRSPNPNTNPSNKNSSSNSLAVAMGASASASSTNVAASDATPSRSQSSSFLAKAQAFHNSSHPSPSTFSAEDKHHQGKTRMKSRLLS